MPSHPPASTSTPALPDFSGLWIPLVTPFAADGRVDHAALKRLARRLAGQGIAGFAVCGSTAEAAALDEDEQLAVLHTVRDAVPQLPCMMGLGGEQLRHVLQRLERLNDLGLHSVLVAAPAYIRPAQDGLLQWFTRIADASAQPLVIYDIPYRTGSTLHLSTLRELAAHPRIAAIKDCSGDAAKLHALLADGQLQVLAGEDPQIFSTVAAGGAGAIAASAHLHTARFAEVIRLLGEGKLDAARQQWRPLPPLIDALFAHPNPAAIKALLAHHGELQDVLRAPMTRAPAALMDRLLTQDQAVMNAA